MIHTLLDMFIYKNCAGAYIIDLLHICVSLKDQVNIKLNYLQTGAKG